MKQILLITDGCSNHGTCPVATAAHVYSQGISVNVIGILDDGHLGKQGAREIVEIAEAGGGMSRTVYARQLAHTMQMMTRQTVAHTLQQVINRQLKDVFGQPQIEQLPPENKAKVVEVMDQMQETMTLQISLLVDTSLSMKHKLNAVEEAISDLLLNLRSRRGKTELCVFHFPKDDTLMEAGLLLEWTSDLSTIPVVFRNIEHRGVTPTGPALGSVMNHLLHNQGHKMMPTVNANSMERGLWSEYVV